MSTVLETIIETKRIEIATAKADFPFDTLQREALSITRSKLSLRKALQRSETGIIAEFKRRSPSKGFINENASVAEVVAGYQKAGAVACSILTDTDYFGGSYVDLQEARAVVKIPLIRKDFIIDKYQICEARAWGADAILLIASALTPIEVKRLSNYAHMLGLEVLLEIHNASELAHICPSVDVVGVNNRNLSTFETDIQTSFELAEQIPAEYLRISESGISSTDTVRSLRSTGFQGFLMGENFMKTSDPAESLAVFIKELK